jgi:CBS-domain-containing membrane protein
MSRRDDQLDATLRHLGVTYYRTVHGKATATDVARALEAVAVHSVPGSSPADTGAPAPGAGLPQDFPDRPQRVRNVMNSSVIIATPRSSYKHVARLLHENRISAMPVLTRGGRVAGMVSEADLLPKHDRHARGLARILPSRIAKADARTAGELMTSPAITIGPDAPVSAAARLMERHHLRLLPVVDTGGVLTGIVSRHDLLKVFLRPDQQIAAEVTDVLTTLLLLDPARITVTVRDGVVTLTGQADDPGQVQTAIRMAEDVDGVIAVTSSLTMRPTTAWTRPPG